MKNGVFQQKILDQLNFHLENKQTKKQPLPLFYNTHLT